jgi:hypothetical protein
VTASARPDEQVFTQHITDGPFQAGVDRRHWRLISVEWPYAIIAVSAAPRPGGPAEFYFRFELSNYPQVAPTAQPWNVATQSPLPAAQWPAGPRRVSSVFRPDWKGGQCLYLPCDRVSMQGHDGWRAAHPHLLWQANHDITLYLEAIYDLVNCSDYSGVHGT